MQAFAFTVFGGHVPFAVVVLANSVEEAEPLARARLRIDGEFTLFNHAVSILYPARIECRESPTGFQVDSENKVYDGEYCFISGYLCCVKGEKKTISQCKRVDYEQMILAVIYNDNHYIYPR